MSPKQDNAELRSNNTFEMIYSQDSQKLQLNTEYCRNEGKL